MHARATFRGHPLHPLLVKLPIACYLIGFVALVTFVATTSGFAYRSGYLAMLVGAGVGLLAAVFGILDLSRIPREIPAKRVGTIHAGAATSATLLFAAAGLVMHQEWVVRPATAPLEYGLPLVLSSIALVLLLVAGALGMHLVTHEHVGLSPIPGHADRIRLDEQVAHPVAPLTALDAVTVIREQHDRIDTALQSLVRAPHARRRSLFVAACNEIEAHAEVEETLFYRSFTHPDGRHLDEYAADHQRVRTMLSALGRACDDDESFVERVAFVAAALAAHQTQEEQELLPHVIASTSVGERERLGAEMLALHAQLTATAVHHNIEPESRRVAHV